jgi:hypothetical protein
MSAKNLCLLGMGVVALLQLIGAAKAADSSTEVNITVDPHQTLQTIPPRFAGLSYESSMLPPDRSGRHYFSPDNTPLINLFRTLGIKSLRLGGATVDNPRFVAPDQNDVDSLFGFARSAGVKVIYSFRLKDGDLNATRSMARYIVDHYSDNLDCFTIGNEPNEYFSSFAKYLSAWRPYFDAISRENPQVKFCGPSAWREEWAKQFADGLSEEQRRRIAFVSQHVYAFGPADHVKDAVTARALLIGRNDYNSNFGKFGPEILKDGLRYRIEETNSYARGGEAGASDSYVAALWSLDYLYWWAVYQAEGINFHTGEFSPAGHRGGFRYSAFVPSTDGYAAWPLSYGLLAFSLGSHGDLVDSRIVDEKPPMHPDLKIYAVLGSDHAVYVTIINRSNGATAADARVSVSLPSSSRMSRVQSIGLVAPSGDLAAKTGITVGGGAIGANGVWAGNWKMIDAETASDRVATTVPAGAAVILKIEQ